MLLAPGCYCIRKKAPDSFCQSYVFYLYPCLWLMVVARQQQIYTAFFIPVSDLCPATTVTHKLINYTHINGRTSLSIRSCGINAGKDARCSFNQLPGVLQLSFGIIAVAEPNPGVFRLTPQHGT